MKIIVCAATETEIKPLLNMLKEQQHHHIDFCIAGIGMVSTTYHLGKALREKKYDLAINAGIAGTFNREWELGDVVHVTEDCFSEVGAENGEDFLSLIQMELQSPEEFPYTWGQLVNTTFSENNYLKSLKKATGITVNTVHGDSFSIEKIKKRLHPDIESMEGAAFFYTCMMENIPCIQIRSISNYVEQRNKDRWDIPLSITNLNKSLFCLVSTLNG